MTSAFTPIDESLKPQSLEDEARRAYFFCREIETRCQLGVIDALQYMLPSADDSDTPASVDWSKPHKLLTCSLIYCSAIECGGISAPEWLMDFLFTALRLADEADENPVGKQMIERLGSYEKNYLLKQIGEEISQTVPGLDSEAVTELVLEYGLESTDDRMALLQTALTLPVENIADLLRMLDMSAT